MEAFWAAPPVTRTLAVAIFIESILVAVNILDPYLVVYSSDYLLKVPPEIWRLFSSFFLTFGFGIIMEPFFIWQYGIALETRSSKFNSASFLIYILFIGCVAILLAGGVLGSLLFLGPLSLAITYTFAQENRGQQVQFIVFPMDVKFVPYARLFIALVMSGPQAALTDATGILAAHLHLMITHIWPEYAGGTNYLRTPDFVTRFFYGNSAPPRVEPVEVRATGTDFQSPPARSFTNQTPDSNPWGARGPGRRLGG